MSRKISYIFIIFLLLSGPVAAENDTNTDSDGFLSSVPTQDLSDFFEIVGAQEANRADSSFLWITIFVLVLSGTIIYSFEINPAYMVVPLLIILVVQILVELNLLSF